MDAGRAVAARPLKDTPARLDLPIHLGEDAGVVLDAVWPIQNCLPAAVAQLAADHHPSLALVQLNMGGSPLTARLTQRSAVALGLVPGMPVWAQIKAVALID